MALQTGPHAAEDLILLRAQKGAEGISTVEWRPESMSNSKRNPSSREDLSGARRGRGAQNICKFGLRA